MGIWHVYKSWTLSCLIAVCTLSTFAAEYEVDGRITELVTDLRNDQNVTNFYTNAFTVYVQGCAWMIRTTEEAGHGAARIRTVGSVNGTEIFDLTKNVEGLNARGGDHSSISYQKQTSPNRALVYSNSIPVGHLDIDMVGHLWLMFASQCYWSSLGTNTTLLTPVYDWNASALAYKDKKVRAGWELLNGIGSLPREVRYFGLWDETNGLYRASGVKYAGGAPVPAGFVFEERHASYATHSMELDKRVVAEISMVREGCSLTDLLPVPLGQTIVIDHRLAGRNAHGGRYSDYVIEAAGKWPSIEKAIDLAEAHQAKLEQLEQRSPNRERLLQTHRVPALVAFVCVFMLGPLCIYFGREKYRRSRRQP